jgi:peptidoglycan hydrolase CwlO-like protein
MIERCQGTRTRLQDSHSKLQQRQAVLRQCVQKLIDQKNTSEAFLETAQANKPHFERYTEQLVEFEKLKEEYRCLQEENRSLKHQTKENIKRLYNCVSQVSD